ncbi:RNA-binding cell elongation regulator Jag/EloR [Allisonella histaminiformans]|uniref:RNA-binding cell elongation regulator Jag/EloR n=1 Tax=Allisonella histaminiformans TaxID=209880 RepID=UPI002E77D504|nr:RNA-binding cell elongation regulator Jag/EloR [Allisonella histaminiformans]
MKTVKITAKTVDEAVAEGLQKLGATREEAVVRVIEEPTGGLFGLLRKKPAVVEISVPDLAGSTDIAKEAARVVSEAFHDVEEPKMDEVHQKEEPVPMAEPVLPGEKIGGRTAGEPGAKRHIGLVSTPEEQEPEAEETKLAPQEPVEPETVKAEKAPETKPEAKISRREREEFTFSEEEQNETAEAAREFLKGVFQAMDLKITVEKMLSREQILLTLHGERLGLLIGKHGQTLDALQYLTNLAAGKKYHHHYFILLDAENYRSRRKQTLENLAARCASKAKHTGEPVKLEPMPAGERKIIHMALKDDPLISTDSEGEVPYRYVVVKLK